MWDEVVFPDPHGELSGNHQPRGNLLPWQQPGVPRGGAGGTSSPGPQLLEGPIIKNLD